MQQLSMSDESLYKDPLFSRFDLTKTFAILSLIAIVTITTVSGYVFFTFLKENLLKRDLEVTAEFIQSVAQINNPGSFFENGMALEKDSALREYFRHISLIPDVIRAAVYNKQRTIIWSDEEDVIGKTFTDNDELDIALNGTRIYKLERVDKRKKKEHSFLPVDVVDFVESYIPVWVDDKVIGVIELYKSPRKLFDTLNQGKVLVVAVSLFGGSVLYIILFWIVRHASGTITQQGSELQDQVSRLSLLLRNNNELKTRVQRASSRAAEVNEHFLRRTGAELHDGPAQSVGFALLRLDAITADIPDEIINNKENEVNRIRTALSDALSEIRSLSSGLAVPELQELSVEQAILKAVNNHKQRTDTEVLVEMSELPESVSMPVKICVYRMVQEGLNNAFRHAKGCGQRIKASFDKGELTLIVRDGGPGFNVDDKSLLDNNRLGLSGLKQRVESLGGRFTVLSKKGEGVQIIAVIQNVLETF